MPAGDANYELNVDIDWSRGKASTDDFLNDVLAKINALQARVDLPRGHPEALSAEQAGQHARVQVEFAKAQAENLAALRRIDDQQRVNIRRGLVGQRGNQETAVSRALGGIGSDAQRAFVAYADEGTAAAAQVHNATSKQVAVMAQQTGVSIEALQKAKDYVGLLREQLEQIQAQIAFDRQETDASQTSVGLQAQINALLRQQTAAIRARTADLLRAGGINPLAQLEAQAEVFERDLKSRRDLMVSGDLSQDPRYAERLGRTAANERFVELRKQLEFERQVSGHMAENVELVAEETQLRRRRLAQEKVASTTFAPGQADELAKLEAQATINQRLQAGRTRSKVAEFFASDDPEAQADRSREAGAAIEERIAKIKESIQAESLYAAYLEQNAEEVKEEFALRSANNAQLKRIQSEFLAGDTPAARKIREDQAATAVAQAKSKRLKDQEVADLGGTAAIQERGKDAARQEVATMQRRLIVAREALGTAVQDSELMDDRIHLSAKVAVAERQLKEAIDKQTTAALISAGYTTPPPKGAPPRPGAGKDPSFFQRAYGGLTGRDPHDVETGRKFLASRFASTAAYGVSGAVLYGGLSAITDTIKQSEELQAQLKILEAQYAELGRAGELPAVKKAIFEISRETGVATDQMAKLAVQFTGAFHDAGAAKEAEKIAAELSVIGDLAPGEIFNDLIAGARAFAKESPGQTIKEQADAQVAALERMGDLSIQARNLSGVEPKELLDFLGRVGPSANAASVSLEELNAVGAALLQGSGLSGSALGDQMNRILTGFSEKAADLYQLVNTTPELAQRLGAGFDDKLFAGDASALFDLLKAFQGLSDPSLKRNIISELGSRREGQTLAVLFENAGTALEIYSKRNEAAGTRTEEFKRKQDTLKQNLKEFRVEIEQLGLTIFESGLGDFLTFMVQNFTLLAGVVKELIHLFGSFNDATGGLALKIGAVVAALKLFGLAGKGLGKLGLPNTLGAIGSRVAGSTQPGGLFSPYAGYGFGGIPALSGRFQGGGFITRAAQKGGFVGGAASALGNVAPLLAGVGLIELASTIHDERGKGKEDTKALEKIVQDRVDRGEALSSIKKDIEGLNDDYSNLEKLGFFTRGTKNPKEVALDVEQNAEAEAFLKDQINVVLKEKGKDFEIIVDAVDSLGLVGDDGEYHPRTGGNKGEYGRAREILKDYLAHPTDDKLKKQAEDLIAAAKEQGDSGLVIDLNAVMNAADERTKLLGEAADAATELTSPERAVEIADLLRGYQAGEIPASEVAAHFREEIALWEQFIAGARESGNSEAVVEGIKQLTAVQEQAKAFFLEPIKYRATVEAFVNSVRGSGPQAAIDTALQSYRDVVASGVADPSDQLDALEALVSAQRAAFMAWVDAAPDAVTRLARLRQGFDLSPEIRKALVEVQLATGNNKDAVAKIAEAMGQTVDAVSTALTNSMIDSVQGAINLQRMILQARRRDLENAQAVFGGFLGGQGDVSAAIAAVDAALASLADIQVIPAPKSGQASPDEIASAEQAAADEQKAKADKARQEAIAKQNALYDLEAARAAGDPVALARIAQKRAAFAKQVAQTESERIEAEAQYIEATTQLGQAMIGENAARRDVAVAKSFDDGVKAAQAAAANAREALFIARGITAKANAQAALIRADRALNDAIQEAFAARVGILIASAEASGDSVEVARQQLRIIQTQLGRKDLNRTERDQLEAQRVTAEAGVRDAMLSEQRATIDYQLAIGQITKGQAIASLEALLQIPKITEEQIREINLAIKDLRGQLGQDFQFNLPTQLGLPTVYEVRRLGQSGGTGGGYQDNRQINVQVYADTNADPDQIAAAVAAAVGEPTRLGTYPGRY